MRLAVRGPNPSLTFQFRLLASVLRARTALYSRAEKRHLMDPENEDFNDDEQQKRQQKLFKGIMVRDTFTASGSEVTQSNSCCTDLGTVGV
jgi:hypothetical protein